MLPIVPPATRNLIILHVFKDLEPSKTLRRGIFQVPATFWANLLFELVGKLFLTMATSHCPTRLRVHHHSSLSRVRNWQQDRGQHGGYVHLTCFESYPGKHLW